MTDITRKQIIVVDSVDSNEYGDMLFTDKEGNNYKISSKRVQYFEGVVVEGMGVELSYATSYNKEYIYSAVQVKDGLPPPVKAETQRAGDAPTTREKPLAPQEVGLWWKEVGLWLREDTDIKKDSPTYKAWWYAYFAEMKRVLNIIIDPE